MAHTPANKSLGSFLCGLNNGFRGLVGGGRPEVEENSEGALEESVQNSNSNANDKNVDNDNISNENQDPTENPQQTTMLKWRRQSRQRSGHHQSSGNP